jgi:hypothetical protein
MNEESFYYLRDIFRNVEISYYRSDSISMLSSSFLDYNAILTLALFRHELKSVTSTFIILISSPLFGKLQERLNTNLEVPSIDGIPILPTNTTRKEVSLVAVTNTGLLCYRADRGYI